MSGAEDFMRNRRNADKAADTQYLLRLHQEFGQELRTTIPQVLAVLKSLGYPNNPSNVFCHGEYILKRKVRNDKGEEEEKRESKYGYFLGRYGYERSQLILFPDDGMTFDGELLPLEEVGTRCTLSEHDMRSLRLNFEQMLEYAPQAPKEKKFHRLTKLFKSK